MGKNRKHKQRPTSRRLTGEAAINQVLSGEHVIGVMLENDFKTMCLRYPSFPWTPWQYHEYLLECRSIAERVTQAGGDPFFAPFDINEFEIWTRMNNVDTDSEMARVGYAMSIEDGVQPFQDDPAVHFTYAHTERLIAERAEAQQGAAHLMGRMATGLADERMAIVDEIITQGDGEYLITVQLEDDSQPNAKGLVTRSIMAVREGQMLLTSEVAQRNLGGALLCALIYDRAQIQIERVDHGSEPQEGHLLAFENGLVLSYEQGVRKASYKAVSPEQLSEVAAQAAEQDQDSQ